nr:hypothetical protein TetV2_00517 [Oceanusvirus sp.]
MEILSPAVARAAEVVTRAAEDPLGAQKDLSEMLKKMDKKYIFALIVVRRCWGLIDKLDPSYADKTMGLACIMFDADTAGPLIREILARGLVNVRQIAIADVISNSRYCLQYLNDNGLMTAELVEDIVQMAGEMQCRSVKEGAVDKIWVVLWIYKCTSFSIDPSFVYAFFPESSWNHIKRRLIRSAPEIAQFPDEDFELMMGVRLMTEGCLAAQRFCESV